MLTLEERLAKIDADIAAANAQVRQLSDRLKIIRSYKGDTSECAAALKKTKQELVGLGAERRQLRERIASLFH